MFFYNFFILFILVIFCNMCVADYINCSNTVEAEKYLFELELNQTALFTDYANITKQENLANIIQDVEAIKDTSLTINDILPYNKSLYLKRRPPTVCGHPAKAIYHITVMSLDSINEAAMTYSLDVYLTLCWIDHRLRFPETARAYRILDPSWLGELWQPDTIFKNAREVTFHKMLVPNHYLWMLPNKGLVYVAKLTLILTCAMDFSAYPHDTQECDLRIESMSYTNKELVIKWDAIQPLTFSTKDNKIQTPQFRSIHNKTAECTIPYLTGAYSCIKAVFYLRRRIAYHLIHTYFPSGLIVILSWVTFWIKPRDIAARIGLGVTSLLTLATLSTQSQESLPPVSYGKAIDTWMTCCALFVFCSILEYAVVNYLVCRFPENSNDNETEQKNYSTWKGRMQSHFSPHKIQITAHNIDRLSRIFFPTCFILLNTWYWRKYLQENEIDGIKLQDYEYYY